jgi:FtsZ-binding cell division protein ZapB
MVTIALQKLEAKINEVVEAFELMHLQVEEGEQANKHLQHENTELKQQQNEWEQTVVGLLAKLEKLQTQQAIQEEAVPA